MENTPTSRLAYFPISLFGAIMGYCGLTLAFTKIHTLFGSSELIALSLTALTTVFFSLITITYLTKWLKHPQAVQRDFNDSVSLHFFPTFSISLVLLSLLYKDSAPQLASILWHTGAFLQFALLLYIMNNWIHHEKWQITHMNPAWFIPVVGNILIPLGAPTFSFVELGWFFFSIGLIFWLVLNSIVMYRLFFHSPLVKVLEPTLFILIAPPSVGFLSYTTLTGQDEIDNTARILYYTALFMTILLLSQTPRFLKVPFALSWWAYTFPLGAFTSASFVMYEFLQLPLFIYIGLFILTTLSCLTAYLTFKTLQSIKNKKLCIAPPGVQTPAKKD